MSDLEFTKILLVEDNPADIRLFKEAFKEATFQNEFYSVKNSNEANDFLNRQEKYVNVPKPDIILLDINIPPTGGFDVLKKVKANDHLKLTPVIIISASRNERDMLCAYQYHANAFIVKPSDYNSFIKFSDSLGDFWINWARLPGEMEI
ncbi:response regulator [Methanobacterium sp.]|uniref:response regulator n=1 Tax=Methanobacterium sp. TaxID=2164 RepID=UPI003C73AC12